ncbi:hypothetical protein V491_03089 [Pseudogymnoascus sp. VKM F-3775]|nr:hypothetical protein V491_03089 [Pseudogymnoascus sp. VKM F-3775]
MQREEVIVFETTIPVFQPPSWKIPFIYNTDDSKREAVTGIGTQIRSSNLVKQQGYFRNEGIVDGKTYTASDRGWLDGGSGPRSLTSVGVADVVPKFMGETAITRAAAAVTSIAGAFTGNNTPKVRSTEEAKDENDEWEVGFDNYFAWELRKQLQGVPNLYPAPERIENHNLCDHCALLVLSLLTVKLRMPHHWEFPSSCPLCSLIEYAISRFNCPLSGSVRRRNFQILWKSDINSGTEVPILRLCSDILQGLWEETEVPPDATTQLGFPMLPASKTFRFALLRQWLKWCDEKHNCKREGKEPPRLLYVGTSPTDAPRLVKGRTLMPRRYIAVSHRWGLEREKREKYCTTRKNFEAHQREITQLAPTFKDVIEIAQALGVEYVWIDSLCIIQYDDTDWDEQVKFMQSVYTSAYCTIAATSAQDMNQRFLDRAIRQDEYICILNHDSGGRRIFICTDASDFDTEVDNAGLNTRAWILQERLLASRTIHFGAHQMYWECGEGVYCEDLTRLKTSDKKRNFRLDPEFPRLLQDSGVATTLYFIQSLLQDYSSRCLSRDEDRAVAIHGLEGRITLALDCKCRYGIFDLFRHRNLLWRRSDHALEPIHYKARKVPSWSWMAYRGSIKFMDVSPYRQLELFNPLNFDPQDGSILITRVWTARMPDKTVAELNSMRGDPGSFSSLMSSTVWYDNDKQDHQPLVVIIARDEEDGVLFVIVVKKLEEVGNNYVRVGAGWLSGVFNILSLENADARLL